MDRKSEVLVFGRPYRDEIMKRILITLPLVLSVAISLFAGVKIGKTYGPVAVFQNGAWIEAKDDMALLPGEKIKTAIDSKAVLIADDTSRIWVRRNSELEISSLTEEESFFGLLSGKIRAKIKLLTGKKFSIKTPIAVASVRGTDFVITSEGALSVIDGVVNFGDINDSMNVDVGQGKTSFINEQGAVGAPRDMTPEEVQALDADWGNFEEPEEGSDQGNAEPEEEKEEEAEEEMADELAMLKAELQEIVSDIKTGVAATKEKTNETKEEDTAASRTFKDVHGNLVRVEQHFIRPDQKSFQLLNLTKRDTYSYSNKWGWGYNGTRGKRLDLAEVTVTMNMRLPDEMSEWPSYISANADDMHPEKVIIRMTNQTDEMRFTGNWKLKGSETGEYKRDEEGNLTEEKEVLDEDGMVFTNTITGKEGTWKTDMNFDGTDEDNNGIRDYEGYDGDGDDNGELYGWAVSPDIRIYKDDNGNGKFDAGETKRLVRMYTEAYAINDNGSILRLNDFASGRINPFNIYTKIAAEQITFCRYLDGSDFFLAGNLDIVYIPDKIVSILFDMGGPGVIGSFGD